MYAACVTAPGLAPVYAEMPAPTPGPGEVRVRVTAAALTQVARARASGRHYSAAAPYPFVAGVDGVGRLEDGRRVYFALPTPPHGAMATETVVPTERCLAVPDDLDDVTAAALANPGMSSWAALSARAKLAPGETVLVNGATGVSGRLAVATARHLGAKRVIATGRDRAALASVGADAIVALDDAAALAAAVTGVDVVLDYLWGDSAQALLAAAAHAGQPLRFVQIGSASGGDIVLPGAVLRAAAVNLMGSGIGSVSLATAQAAVAAVLAAAIPAGLTIAVNAVPLADVARAWGEDRAGRRIVFVIDQP